MHAHRIEIFDRADDDDVVGGVAHHLELELFPPFDGSFEQDFVIGRHLEAPAHFDLKVRRVAGDRASGAAERARGTNNQRQSQPRDDRFSLGFGMRHGGGRHFEADFDHRLLEEIAILGLFDRVQLGADQLDAELFQHPRFRQLDREIERGLTTDRRQQRIGPLAFDNLRDYAGGHRLDIGTIGQIGVGHDRGRVGVDQDQAQSLFAQRLQRLRSRIVELACLSDYDRAGTDEEHRFEIFTQGHCGLRIQAFQCVKIAQATLLRDAVERIGSITGKRFDQFPEIDRKDSRHRAVPATPPDDIAPKKRAVPRHATLQPYYR